MADLPGEAAALFRVEPERFVPARDELVKRLRTDGRDEDAATVKALRKPTAMVWALDQLAGCEPDALSTLFDAGRSLRAAQQAALGGKGADELLTAGATRRAAVESLTRSTVRILDEAGSRGAPQADAIAAALEICSVDATAGAELAAGILQKPPSAVADLGFGAGPLLTGVAGGRAGTKDVTPRADTARLRRERDAAQKSAKTRRATADRLAGQIAELSERLERLRSDHAAAESDALQAELDAERATRAADDDA